MGLKDIRIRPGFSSLGTHHRAVERARYGNISIPKDFSAKGMQVSVR